MYVRAIGALVDIGEESSGLMLSNSEGAAIDSISTRGKVKSKKKVKAY